MRELPKRQHFLPLRRWAGKPVWRWVELAVCVLICLVAALEWKEAGTRREIASARIAESETLRILSASGSAPSAAVTEKVAGLERTLSGLVRRHPRNAQAQALYGDYLEEMDRLDEAVERWQQAEKLDPDNAEIVFMLGTCDLALGRIAEAAGRFDRSLQLDPKNPLYQYHMGNVLFLFRRQLTGVIAPSEERVLDASLRHFRLATLLEPNNAEYARGYVETFYGVSHPDWYAALAASLHLLQVSSDKDVAYINLARVNLNLGRAGEAREALSKVTGKRFDSLKEKLLKQVGNES